VPEFTFPLKLHHFFYFPRSAADAVFRLVCPPGHSFLAKKVYKQGRIEIALGYGANR
jgi:hypothetical protein